MGDRVCQGLFNNFLHEFQNSSGDDYIRGKPPVPWCLPRCARSCGTPIPSLHSSRTLLLSPRSLTVRGIFPHDAFDLSNHTEFLRQFRESLILCSCRKSSYISVHSKFSPSDAAARFALVSPMPFSSLNHIFACSFSLSAVFKKIAAICSYPSFFATDENKYICYVPGTLRQMPPGDFSLSGFPDICSWCFLLLFSSTIPFGGNLYSKTYGFSVLRTFEFVTSIPAGSQLLFPKDKCILSQKPPHCKQ